MASHARLRPRPALWVSVAAIVAVSAAWLLSGSHAGSPGANRANHAEAATAAKTAVVSVTSPTAGATVSGTTTLGARAPGAGKVTWYVDQAPAASDTSPGWRQPWDSTRVRNGQHQIFAIAAYGAGRTARSTDVTFTVLNAPASTSPAPTAGPLSPTPSPSATTPPGASSSLPPPRGGYFSLLPVGSWSSLPSDGTCAAKVHYSTWEPRPDNSKRNHVKPDPAAVHRSLGARTLAAGGSYDPRWDRWLRQRVDGQFAGTTDEIFQWAACKWGLSDDMLRAIAVRESTWYQYETYRSGRPVVDWGSGDMMPAGTAGANTYCNGIAGYGFDYQPSFGSGICPRTFSIAGVMSWQDPSWDVMPGNQNGSFPFNRDSTAFAVDYLASELRGCYEGWEFWLKTAGTRTYAAGDIWGCVGNWYAGDWHTSEANGYISRVRGELANFTWLSSEWPSIKPPCDPAYGCPGPDPL